MQNLARPALLVLVVVLHVACGSQQAAPTGDTSASLEPFLELEGRLDIAGGTAHIPVMTEAARRIMTANPRIRITVAGGGSGVGAQKVGEGLVQIGNTGRPLSDGEKAEYGLVSFPFAVDGVAVVVHPGNGVRGLTTRQVRDIFSGKIADWSEVGGVKAGINLYTRDEASGTREVFWKRALGKGDVARGANVVPSNGAMKTAVSNDPQAIGYLSIGHIDGTVAPVALEGVEPSQENAKSGAYEVTRLLYMNTKGEPEGLTRAFIDYLLGTEGAEIAQDCGYIPVAPGADR